MNNLNKKNLSKKINTKRLVFFSLAASAVAGITTALTVKLTDGKDSSENNDGIIINHEVNVDGGSFTDGDIISVIEFDQFRNILDYIQESLINNLNVFSLSATTSFSPIPIEKVTNLANARDNFARYLGLTGVNADTFFTSLYSILDSPEATTISGSKLSDQLSFLYTREEITKNGLVKATITPVYGRGTTRSITPTLSSQLLDISVDGFYASNQNTALSTSEWKKVSQQVTAEYRRISHLNLNGTINSPKSTAVSNLPVTNLDDFGINGLNLDNDKFIYRISHNEITRSGSYQLSLSTYSKTNELIFSDEIVIRITANIQSSTQSNGVGSLSPTGINGGVIAGATVGAATALALPFAAFTVIKRMINNFKVSSTSASIFEHAEGLTGSYNSLITNGEMPEILHRTPFEHTVPEIISEPVTSFSGNNPAVGGVTISDGETGNPLGEVVETPSSEFSGERMASLVAEVGESGRAILGATSQEVGTVPDSIFLAERATAITPAGEATSGMAQTIGKLSGELSAAARVAAARFTIANAVETVSQLAQTSLRVQGAGGARALSGFSNLPDLLQERVAGLFSRISSGFADSTGEIAATFRRLSAEVGQLSTDILVAEVAEGLTLTESNGIIGSLIGHFSNTAGEAGFEVVEGLDMLASGFAEAEGFTDVFGTFVEFLVHL